MAGDGRLYCTFSPNTSSLKICEAPKGVLLCIHTEFGETPEDVSAQTRRDSYTGYCKLQRRIFHAQRNNVDEACNLLKTP